MKKPAREREVQIDENMCPSRAPITRANLVRMGYPAQVLERMPILAIQLGALAVSNLSVAADIPQGAAVLDLGCGGGLDTLIAAERVGTGGKVIGVDFTENALALARQSAAEARKTNVEFRLWSGDALPIEDANIDVALVNTLIDLSMHGPSRECILAEILRVLRPDSTVWAADVVLTFRPSEAERKRIAEEGCSVEMSLANEVSAFVAEFYRAGFREVELRRLGDDMRTEKASVTKIAEVVARK